jgi:CheY-like chemotaxis protein
MSASKTVLMIDDDVDFLEANRIALEASGYAVITASDSRTGAQMARSHAPDLIVLDLMMERMDSGFSLLEELAHGSQTRGIPVLMVSAVTTETGLRIDHEGIPPDWLHVVDFINKPIDPIQLAEKVASILNRGN